MARPQVTINRLLIVTAVIAACLALLRLCPPESRRELAAWLVVILLCWSALLAGTRLIDTRNTANQNTVGYLLLIVGIILFGLAASLPLRAMVQ